jgi:raffinose/stachyose/melibiose transport system permease protein
VADLDLGATVATVIFTLMLGVTAIYFWLVQRRLRAHAT